MKGKYFSSAWNQLKEEVLLCRIILENVVKNWIGTLRNESKHFSDAWNQLKEEIILGKIIYSIGYQNGIRKRKHFDGM